MRICQPYKLVLISISSLVLTSCDYSNLTGGSSPNAGYNQLPSIVRVVDLKIEPNPVLAGDSVLFTCVYEHKQVPNIYFQWSIPPNHVEPSTNTTDNFLKIKATDQPGIYQAEVAILNSDPGTVVRAIFYEFEYEVIE